MLSILIPVYNFDIRNLVKALHEQCEQCEISYEILCFDDGSTSDFIAVNESLGQLKNVEWQVMPENYGRSKIRNVLGKAAQFPYLIFMDCDSGVVSPNYISNYLEIVNSQSLLYGGRVYKNTPPREKEYLFHWKYGKQREESTAKQRAEAPYHSFMTNNFLIPKSIFLDIQFDERLTQYGHEDTIFGLELRKRNIPILHLENPLEHLGLETTDVFLEKTRKGIQNLYFLHQQNELMETRLLSFYKRLKRKGMVGFVKILFQIFEKQLVRNFKSNNPKLVLFDIYKLGYLCRVSSL